VSRSAAPAGRPSRPPRNAGDKPGGGAGRSGGRAQGKAGSGPAGGRPRSAGDPARLVAYETLRAVAERDAYANLVLPGLLRRARLHGRDAGLATELAYGTLRGRGTYDAVLAACIDRPLDQVDPAVLDGLRLGVHQLLNTRVPQHAAVSTTVDLVRATSGPGASKFANAVLRRVTEHPAETWPARVAPDADQDPDGHLAVLHSHPGWIVRALRDALRTDGRPVDELPELLAAHNARPRVAVAALPGLATVAELIEAGADPGVLSPLAVLVQGAPEDALAIEEGRARVQDEGSQLVTLALAAAPLQGTDAGRWLDLCAGPGGKAALLAALLAERHADEQVGDDAELVAVEVAEHRAGLVSQALAPIPSAYEVRVADGRSLAETEPGRYDRVLVDAPCTGLGALRRRPEARWRRTPADLAALAPLQRGLLTSALDAVRPGGVVAYVTCSPHPAETSAVVDDVLRTRTDVTRLNTPALVAELLAATHPDLELGGSSDLQLWTHRHGTDSMYLALLRRG
jgi:16S rRNA (cytosine967-C5)-methyltransferase